MAAAPQVLVCGGGIIGAATSYYLAQKGARPVVVEATGPACSASGKAGAAPALAALRCLHLLAAHASRSAAPIRIAHFPPFPSSLSSRRIPGAGLE